MVVMVECGSVSRWYCVNTHPGKERLACEQLAEQAFRTFTPYETLYDKKHHPVTYPLFRSYIFVAFTLEQRWQAIYSTRGVKRILSSTPNSPTPVPDELISTMMREQGEGVFDRTSPQICDATIGREVIITKGPFAQFSGIVHRTEKQRVEILLGLFGRPITVKLERTDFALCPA